jgi:DNA-binding MarR family transcriptional regulator
MNTMPGFAGTATDRRKVADDIESGQVAFLECTAYKTRQLARKVMTHFEASIVTLGIKGTQFSLLGCVLRDGPIKPSALAQVMELSASTLSRNVKPLIAQGWLTMSEGTDARSRLLAITPEGKKLFKQAGKRWQDAQAALGQELGTQLLAVLHGIVDSTLQRWPQTKS